MLLSYRWKPADGCAPSLKLSPNQHPTRLDLIARCHGLTSGDHFQSWGRTMRDLCTIQGQAVSLQSGGVRPQSAQSV
jgi:hypothetical protein